MAACLCLGMAACGDDEGTNPGGSNGEGGSVGSELKFTGLNRQTYFDGVSIYNNSRNIGYNEDGTPQYMSWVENDEYIIYEFEYADNAQGGSTITVRYINYGPPTKDHTPYICEVNPEGHITLLTIYNLLAKKDKTIEYTYDKDGRMTKAVETSYDLSGNIEGGATEHNISWKNGNITRIEAVENDGAGSMYTYTYKYTSYPSSKGIVYSHFMNLTPLLRPTNLNGDEYMDFFANLTEYFGQRPKNLLSSVTKTYNNGTKKGSSTTRQTTRRRKLPLTSRRSNSMRLRSHIIRAPPRYARPATPRTGHTTVSAVPPDPAKKKTVMAVRPVRMAAQSKLFQWSFMVKSCQNRIR